MRPEASDMRLLMRCVTKLYEQCLENIRGEYGLSQIEIAIIGFLYNNPGKDTAAEIVELRRLPKGNVSQGVELLVKKGLVKRNADTTDRRKVHLSLLPAADPVSAKMQELRSDYEKRLFDGMTEEEHQTFIRLSNKVIENSKKIAERRK